MSADSQPRQDGLPEPLDNRCPTCSQEVYGRPGGNQMPATYWLIVDAKGDPIIGGAYTRDPGEHEEPTYRTVEVVPVDVLKQERQAVLDVVNLYGDETLHKALDAIGWPRASPSGRDDLMASLDRADQDLAAGRPRLLDDDLIASLPESSGQASLDEADAVTRQYHMRVIEGLVAERNKARRQSRGAVELLREIPEGRLRQIVDEVTDMGSTPTPRQEVAALELARRGGSSRA